MGRGIRVVAVHCPRRFTHAHIGHAGIAVEGREIGAAHGAILIEQQGGTKDPAVVVEVLGFFQVLHPVVDPVFLLVQQSGVKPGRRVPGIQVLGPVQFLSGQAGVSGVAESLAEITAQRRAIRLQRGGHLQVEPARLGVTPADLAKAASQPCVAQGRIDRDGLVKPGQGLTDPVLRHQQKAFERNRFGIAGRQLQSLLQRG